MFLGKPNIDKLKANRNIKKLVHVFLKHKDWLVKNSAGEALLEIGEPAVDYLIKIMTNAIKVGTIRELAGLLGRIGDARATKPLIAALGNDDWHVRMDTINALVRLQNTDAIPYVIKAMSDADAAVREAAVRGLGVFANHSALMPVIKALADDKLRTEAATALVRIANARGSKHLIGSMILQKNLVEYGYVLKKLLGEQDVSVQKLLKDTISARSFIEKGYWELLELLDLNAIWPLLSCLEDADNWWIRAKAAMALGRIGHSVAVDRLFFTLMDSNSSIRCAAAEALGRIGDKRAIPPLCGVLNDKSLDVIRSGIAALGKMGDASAVGPLIQALRIRDDLGIITIEASASLAMIGTDAVEHLLEALQHEDEAVRAGAAKALGRIGSEAAVDHLIRSLQDDKWRVRLNSAEALEAIGSKRALVSLVRCLHDSSEGVQLCAIKALGRTKHETAIEDLIPFLNAYDTRLALEAIKALGSIGGKRAMEALADCLDNKNILLGIAAAVPLAESGDSRAIEFLITTAIRHKWYEAYEAAERALAGLRIAAPEMLFEIIKDDTENIRIRERALHVTGVIRDPNAVPALIRLLVGDQSDDNTGIRESAASALGDIGDARMVTPLIEAMEDKQVGVWIKAIYALAKINDEESRQNSTRL